METVTPPKDERVVQPWEDIDEDTTLMGELEKWLMTRNGLHASVADAAAHFGVRPERIEQAAGAHYWMGIDNALGVPTVFIDGE